MSVEENCRGFLKFVTADLKESEGDFQDRLVSQLQKTIRDIKTDREMEELGPVPDQLRDRLEELEELGDLRTLLKLAAKADSLDVFKKEAEKYLQSSQS